MAVNHSSSSGGSTVVLEMPSRSHHPGDPDKDVQVFEELPAAASSPHSTSIPQLQQWNTPRINMWRCLATFYSFIILGANDGTYGALIPYLETWYNINYTIVSLVFLCPIVGYTASALLNNHIHTVYGQRGVAWIMSVSHLIAYTILCVHPPYPVFVLVFILVGFGNGLGDSGWNAWIGDMANANEVLGVLHGFYGLGAALSPLIATTLVTKAGWRWYQFYYLMVGGAAIEVLALVSAFWNADGPAYRAGQPHTADTDGSGANSPNAVDFGTGTSQADKPHKGIWSKISPFGKRPKGRSRTLEAVKNKVTLLTSVFLLIYVGIEVSIGGWIVTFMLRVRKGTPFASGMTSMGFWLGITVGRFVLGFVTARLFRTEKHAVAVYLLCSVGLQLLFWLIPNFFVSAAMVGLLGFFLGPLFPAAVVTLTKLLPKKLHVPAVGFAAAFGASGACSLPFVVGAIANAKGVKVLQPIILAALACCLIIWLLVPKLPKQRMS